MDYVTLPKIELHAHLTGSVSRQTLHEIWLSKGSALEDPLVVMPENQRYDIKTFFPLFNSYIYNLLSDAASIKHATTSVLASFHADGVTYLELRTTPRRLPTMQAYASAVCEAIHAFRGGMSVRLILCVDRARHSLADAWEVLRVARSHPLVVGMDLCGDPNAAQSVDVFTPIFREAKRGGLGVTVHFGEIPSSKGELDTLLSWGPTRLGHAVHVDEVRGEIVRRGLCLELCLSCNVKAGMVDGFGSHHFGEWRGVDGVSISLGTDDVGVFESPLSNEYRLVAQHFGLDQEQVCALARSAVEHIFADEQEKQRLRQILW